MHALKGLIRPQRRRQADRTSPVMSRFTFVACAIGCLVAGDPARAQDDLEQIIVTGSRIARPDFESASPIVSVTEELFQRTGSGTVETALNTLPQFVPSYTSTSNNPGNNGQANVNLRGLGTTSTLVLLDGKRLIPGSGNGVADLNVVPSALIESVEIVTGGASAVYGSDALAGVVNFKLKRDFDGVEIDGTWGQTSRGDGTQYEAGLTAGTNFANGRGSIVGYVGYADRELVTYLERDFAKYALAYAGGPGRGTLGPDSSFLPAGSTFIEEGRVTLNVGDRPSEAAFDALMVSYGYAPGEVPYFGPPVFPDGPLSTNTQFGFNDDGTVFTTGNFIFSDNQFPGVRNFRAARDPVFYNDYFYSYNFAPDNALQLPLERNSAFLRAEFELSEAARFYAQGLYADYSTTAQLAPTPVGSVFIPVDNPFVPADFKLLLDSRADPTEAFTFAKRLSETGPRTGTYDNEIYQVTLGVAGRVFDGWSYEAYAQLGANDQEDFQTGNVLTSRMEELTFAPDGGVSICGGFDPFGKGSISAECLDYIQVDASNHAAVDQAIAEVSLTGPLASLPAGELVAAFGVFYKEDKYEYVASPAASVFLPDGRADIQGFVASKDIKGDDHNLDLYTELLVPLLRDIPGVRSLETVLGYRSSDYASAGRFGSWKAELLFQPVESLRVRGSYQDAVRAPSVLELYLPQLPAEFDFLFDDVQDPCTVDSPQRTGPDASRVEALCLAHGMPASVLPTFVDADELATGVQGGNPDLHQEEAATVTLGVVWISPFEHPALSNLQVSIDWYQIEIDDKIAFVPYLDFISYCYDARYNPDLSASNQWCALFRRDATSGEITDVHEISSNALDWETSGIDVQVDWQFELGPGRLGVSWFVSWLDSYSEAVTGSSVPAIDKTGTIGGAGTIGGSLPEWKSNLHASYAWRDLTVGASWRYIDAMTDEAFPDFRVPQVNYVDLSADYEFSSGLLAGLRLGIGVENVADEDPPIYPSFIQANTNPSQYDAFGRRYYASFRYSF
jgi:iron complex outermembrane receptor protein